jgi:signal transduction histidine kinase
VARRGQIRDPSFGPHLRGRSVRFRLTALYCGLFLPASIALVVITSVVTFLSLRPVVHIHRVVHRHGTPVVYLTPGGAGVKTVTPQPVVQLGSLRLDSHEFLVGSCSTLAAMIGVCVLLGWLFAGRVLQPLRTITDTTRNISENDLHRRLALPGPRDELTELGDTIDGLLARLEAAFDSQRSFVANASHELRTPLMLSQTLLQVALADPAITLDSLRAVCQEAVDAGKDQAQLIDALLILARSQRGLDHREPLDLTAVVNDALNAHEPSARARRLHVEAALEHAEVPGDTLLIYRLVSNLLDNAIRYNTPGGRVEVKLAASVTEATLTVTNTGPAVPPNQVSRLLEPFQRAAPDRTASPHGLGLGLSIIADIAEAHGASLDVRPRPEGGLIVAVRFPVRLPAPDT